MRFRLVEREFGYTPTALGKNSKVKPEYPPTRDTLEKFNKLKISDEKISFVKDHILRHSTFKKLFGVRSIIIDSILCYGLNPKKNLFLNFIANMPVPFSDRKSKPKMQYIYDSFKNNKLKITDRILSQVLYNPSLYDRSDKEFRYTLNAFNIMSQPKKAGAYLKNTENVDITKFLMSGNDFQKSTIKPGGSDGKEGDTIFNVIEGWAKDNEYSPEEIADNKNRAEEEEKEKENGKSKSGSDNWGNRVPPASEWTYDYFKGELEKIFANKGKFKTTLPSKNDYLNRAFATFSLATMSPIETTNKIYKKSANDIKDADVTKFGDPHNVDEPIPLNVRTSDKEIPGVYVFHQFIPLDNASLTLYKQVANKNMGNLKRHLNKVSPNDDDGVDTHSQRIVDAIGSLQEITHR